MWSSSPVHLVSTAPKSADVGERFRQQGQVRALWGEHLPPILGHEDQMHGRRETHVLPRRISLAVDVGPVGTCSPGARYRAYPTPGRRNMLARTLGCARVVFNDALHVRDAAHNTGRQIIAAEVQRRVITLAATTPWTGVARRGRIGRAGPGVSGRAARVPRLV
jgi:hypothetical protein